MENKAISRRSFLTISAMTAMTLVLDWEKISAYAENMGPGEDYPTVIIGAGLGGLICGAYLAKQGIPVTVIEQHDIPGGYATAFSRAKGGFNFEVALHGTAIHNNSASRLLEELGVLDKLELVALPEVYRLKTPKLDISVPQRNPEAYIKMLAEHFPAEEKGIRGFVDYMIGLADETDKINRNKGKFVRLLFPIQYPRMWNVRNKTLSDLLNDHIENNELKEVLSALWGYYGLPPSRLSGFYYANATGGYLRDGSYNLKHRSQDLSNRLAEAIEDHGGKMIYDTEVKRILVENGAVEGVVLSNKKTLPARAVVSNASAPATFREMLPKGAVPKAYMDKLAGYKPSISSFIVWLGLNRELRGKIKGFSTHVSSGQGSEIDYQSCLTGDIENQSFSVCVYDNLFEGYSVPGTSTLQVLILSGYEPWRRFESDYWADKKTGYNAEKSRWTDILIRRAEEALIPGLSSMIEVKEAATPLTNWCYTGNTEGAIYGFEQSMDNTFMNRIENRTPIKGLYLASAWGNPGGGFGGAFGGGQGAFRIMMEDWGG